MTLTYNAKRTLMNLTELAKDNLAADPPRITNEALLEAFRRNSGRNGISITVRNDSKIIPFGFSAVAEEINDMIKAGQEWRNERGW